MREILILLLTPFLGSGAKSGPWAQFIETHGAAGLPEFVSRAGQEWIGIGQDGWSRLNSRGERVGGLRFLGKSVSTPFETLEPAGIASFFVGSDRERWLTGAHTFARLRQTGVYPGVDVVYYQRDGRLEYHLMIAPGAALNISLYWTGDGEPELEPDGSLNLRHDSGVMTLAPPLAYQTIGNERRWSAVVIPFVIGRFILNSVRSTGHKR